MTLIILCENYDEYAKYIRTTFPILSANQNRMLAGRDFVAVFDLDSVDKCLGLERNMPCLTLPGFDKVPKKVKTHILDTLNAMKQVVHINVAAKLDRRHSR